MSDLFSFADTHYPVAAGFKARETSSAAAEAQSKRAPYLRQMCLDKIRACECTADECADALGIDKLSIRPRFSELAALGKIFDTGHRRRNSSGKTAIVWRAL
jgi:hypothetical protein